MNDGVDGGIDTQLLEGFIVSVMRNFFLDLSVDQIEVLCTNFAKKFVAENTEEKPEMIVPEVKAKPKKNGVKRSSPPKNKHTQSTDTELNK